MKIFSLSKIYFSSINHYHILRIMRFTAYLLFIFTCVAFAEDAKSQNARVDLKKQQVPLNDVLEEIEQQTDYLFISNKNINLDQKVSIRVKSKPVKDVLNKLFKGTDIFYAMEGVNIILTQKNFEPGVVQPLQQNRTVTGVVNDEKGLPIPGVNVVVKGTMTGVITDVDGKFETSVPGKETVLVFSFIGYNSMEIPVGDQKSINVTLTESVEQIEEVVIVGYGTQKKINLTGSVSVVKMSEIRDDAATTGNVLKALDGKVPGIKASYDGNPNNVANIQIRGQGSLYSSTAPLIIVDGIPTIRGLNELPPNDIESIQILKDAAAATIYGSRAAGGVYIITTKSAKKGTNVEFNSSVTLGIPTIDRLKLMTTDEWGRAQWMAARNDKRDPNYGFYTYKDHQDANGNWVLDELTVQEWLDPEKTMKSANTNWIKEISRTSVTQNYNLSLSNAGEKGRMLFSGDWLKSQGTTKHNEWNRIIIRINSDYKMFNDRVKVGENFSVTKMRYAGGSFDNAVTMVHPIIPVHTVDGIGWGGPAQGLGDRVNPVLAIEKERDDRTDHVRLMGSAFADVEIIKNLKFRSTFGLDYTGAWIVDKVKTYKAGFMSEKIAKLTTTAEWTGSWTWNNVLTYDFSLGKNNFNITLGQEANEIQGRNLRGYKEGYALEDEDYMFLDTGEDKPLANGTAWDNALNSYFGRINYDYDGKYLLTAIVRRDGSSRFGANYRYGTFPSISGGWVISRESFMESLEWLDFLKIRYAWGQTGNQEIGNYAWYGMYKPHYGNFYDGTAYDIYGNDEGMLPSGFLRTQTANPNLKWEATTQNNFGVDVTLLNSRLTGSFDYYLKETTDMLVNPPTLLVTGVGANYWLNGATMKNWGWEAILGWSDNIGEVRYAISANIFRNNNEFVYVIPQAVPNWPGNGKDKTILGRSVHSMFGHITDGLFQSQAEVDAYTVDQPGKGLGRLRYVDIGGPNGVPDGKIDDDDRDYIGVNAPDLSWGLNMQVMWRNLDFALSMNSEIGREISSPIKGWSHFFGFYAGHNYGRQVLDCWSPTNTSSTIPAITAANTNHEDRFSTYFVENTSYVKIQSMSLGYTFPQLLSGKLLIKKARFYLNADNLWTIKLKGNTYTGFDSKNAGIDFPLPISIAFGVNLIF